MTDSKDKKSYNNLGEMIIMTLIQEPIKEVIHVEFKPEANIEKPWEIEFEDTGLFKQIRAMVNYPGRHFATESKAAEVAEMLRDIIRADAVTVEDDLLPRDDNEKPPFFHNVQSDEVFAFSEIVEDPDMVKDDIEEEPNYGVLANLETPDLDKLSMDKMDDESGAITSPPQSHYPQDPEIQHHQEQNQQQTNNLRNRQGLEDEWLEEDNLDEEDDYDEDEVDIDLQDADFDNMQKDN